MFQLNIFLLRSKPDNNFQTGVERYIRNILSRKQTINAIEIEIKTNTTKRQSTVCKTVHKKNKDCAIGTRTSNGDISVSII